MVSSYKKQNETLVIQVQKAKMKISVGFQNLLSWNLRMTLHE